MPIVNLLDSRARFPRLGIIRLGVKVETPGGKSRPAAVDHFVVDDDLAAKLSDPKPTMIEVTFPSNDPERVVDAYFRRYEGSPDNPAGGVLTLRCDGITAAELPREGKPTAYPCKRDPADPRAECSCGAKAVARLNVVVLKGGIGTYQLVFGGMGRIADVLEDLWLGRRAYGRLVGVPARLCLEPVPMEFRDKNGRRQKRQGWAPRIRWVHTYQEALNARGQDPLALDAAPVEVGAEVRPKALSAGATTTPVPHEVSALPISPEAPMMESAAGRHQPPDAATAGHFQRQAAETEPDDLFTEASGDEAAPAEADRLHTAQGLARALDVDPEGFAAYLLSRCGPEPSRVQIEDVIADLQEYAQSSAKAAAFKASCRAAKIARDKRRAGRPERSEGC